MINLIQKTCYRFSSGFQLPPLNFQPQPYRGIPYEQIMSDRAKYMPNFYFAYYKKPLLITEGHMQYLFDHQGNRYIDLIAGISTVGCGHSHPDITRVVQQQAAKLTHTSPIYFSEWQAEYSKRLCQELGPEYDSVYLCNSGGQANDFAIYLARLFTHEYKFLSLRNGYHGMAGNAKSITNIGTWNSPMQGTFQFEKLQWPSQYRGNYSHVNELIVDAQQHLNSTSAGKVAGFIFESIQGVGGLSPMPPHYIPQMVDLVRNKYGGLIIVDQVQTGFGRIGTAGWGHKWQGIKPDIITMAKGIGNGLPLGAVVTRKEITDKIKQVYFNTYGGGHIQSRVGIQVLDIIKRQKLAENAEKVGNYLMTQLKKIAEKSKIVGDVRGKGLMIGVEIVKNKETKEPGKQQTAQLMELTRERRLLFGKGGVFGNVLRIQPPLCLSMADAQYVVKAFECSLLQVKS